MQKRRQNKISIIPRNDYVSEYVAGANAGTRTRNNHYGNDHPSQTGEGNGINPISTVETKTNVHVSNYEEGLVGPRRRRFQYFNKNKRE
jgi:hypothetical protein